MIIIILLFSLFDIYVGTQMLNSGIDGVGGTFLSIVGFIFVALGVIPLLSLIFNRPNNNEAKMIRIDEQTAYDKYVRGLSILERYYNSGINNISDIADPEERMKVQRIYNYCESYSRAKKEMQYDNYEEFDEYNETQDSNNGVQTAATVAAGVALGAVLSSAVSKAVRSSYDRTLEYIRKNNERNKT